MMAEQTPQSMNTSVGGQSVATQGATLRGPICQSLNHRNELQIAGDGTGVYGPYVDHSRALATPIGPVPVGAPMVFGEPQGPPVPL